MMVSGRRNHPRNALERAVVLADVAVEVIVDNQIRRRPRKDKAAVRIRTSASWTVQGQFANQHG
jgi:hypothetical protein